MSKARDINGMSLMYSIQSVCFLLCSLNIMAKLSDVQRLRIMYMICNKLRSSQGVSLNSAAKQVVHEFENETGIRLSFVTIKKVYLKASKPLSAEPPKKMGRPPISNDVRQQIIGYVDNESVPSYVKSTRKMSAASLAITTRNVSRESIRKILHDDGLFPYKFKKGQKLITPHKEKRMIQCYHFLDIHVRDKTFFDRVYWTDESIFTLNGHVNKQTMRFWARTDPKKYIEISHHPSKVMMFAAIHKTKGIIRGFFDRNVDQYSYVKMLEDNIMPAIIKKRSNPHDISEDVWMQDGAPCHTTEYSLSYLYSNFEFIISNKAAEKEMHWPASSPDLNCCDNWLWSYVKSKTFAAGPLKTIAELKQRIGEVIDVLNNTQEGKDMIARACSRFMTNVRLCIANEGGHLH